MIKRLLVVAVFAVAAGACAPAMQRSISIDASCVSVRHDLAMNQSTCMVSSTQRVLAQEPQEKKTPPPGPGKRDFTTWMALLTMGFGALYLMAFK